MLERSVTERFHVLDLVPEESVASVSALSSLSSYSLADGTLSPQLLLSGLPGWNEQAALHAMHAARARMRWPDENEKLWVPPHTHLISILFHAYATSHAV